jgi:ABC-type bacteriocin/lantibiotic exporter with double-glycine peptidase domain
MHVPLVRQLDEMDCGAACVAMVCRAFGRTVPINRIRDAVGTSVNGTTLSGIRRGGEAIGLQVKPLKVSKERLDTLPLPAIIHWRGVHWMVLDDVAGDRVHVADPAGASRWIARDEFLEHWTGFTALVSPTPALDEAPEDHADLSWLAPFIRPHSARLALVAGLALTAALLQMLVPVVTGEIIDSVVPHKNYTRLYEMIGGLLVLQAVALAASLLEARLITRVAVKIDGESLDHIASRLLSLPLSYFESRRTGDIEQRLDGVRQVREFSAQQGVSALASICQLIAAIALMGVLSPLLAAVWLATIPVYAVLMRYGAGRVRPAYVEREEGFSRYRSRQLDAIRGAETVKSLGAEASLRRRMRRDFAEVADRIVRADLAAISYGGAISIVMFLMLILFLLLGALEVMAGHLSIGQLVAFNSLVLLSSGPIVSLLGTWDRWQMMSVILGRISDILDRDPEQDIDAAGVRRVPTLGGHVTLTNVGFRYPNSPNTPILEGITLDVPPGSTVAIVGRSGSGKSTLLRCLAGLSMVTAGSIAFDSVDLRELHWTDLRRRIGHVPQKPYVFDDTLARNIAFGEEEPDIQAVTAAAEVADARGFIERMPLEYNTRVGDGGLMLSGGQAQRVAIARSIFHRPPVLLLDEATSALDSEAEHAVTENMRRLLEGRTAFIVAHRLSTVIDADMIVVLEQGRLVEKGTHDELLGREGLYLHLYGQQIASRES